MIDLDDIIGKPHRRGGRGPDAFDCWGVVLLLAERAGFVVPADWASRDMTRAEQRALMSEQCRLRTDRIERPVDGCIAYSESASHVGFAIYGRIIHATKAAGVVAWPAGLWVSTFPDVGFYQWRN